MGITETLAATHLGKKSAGSELYDKSLLVAVPRVENRQAYGIKENALPFVGYDVWNAYEVSFMNLNNIPCNYVLKIKYPCTSPYIVESKSLKLYLNSFNMTSLKQTIKESVDFFLATVKKGFVLNDDKLIPIYLKKKGWKKMKEPRTAYNRKMSAKEYLKHHEIEKAVANVGSHHLTYIEDSKIKDIWNCSENIIHSYWIKA